MIKILTGDFRELSQNLANDSIDLVLTDPPYDKASLPLWADLGAMAARVLKPSGFLVTYAGNLWCDETIGALREYLEFYVLCTSFEPGANSRMGAVAMFHAAKPIYVFQKPPHKRRDACGFKWCTNVIYSDGPDKEFHKWGQNLKAMKELVEHWSLKGDVVLDPFLGGGTTAVACLLASRRCIAFELDPDVADIARRRIEREKLFVPRPGPVQIDFADAGKARCKTCGVLLDQNEGQGRKREYCGDACRQLAYRNRLASDVTLLRSSATGA